MKSHIIEQKVILVGRILYSSIYKCKGVKSLLLILNNLLVDNPFVM